MNETLRLLYDRFYTPLPMVESEQEVETCHRQLIERLDKPERKLVLRIIDAQNLMIDRATLRGQLHLRFPSGVGNGKRTESLHGRAPGAGG